jgi:hypothetical protein
VLIKWATHKFSPGKYVGAPVMQPSSNAKQDMTGKCQPGGKILSNIGSALNLEDLAHWQNTVCGDERISNTAGDK